MSKRGLGSVVAMVLIAPALLAEVSGCSASPGDMSTEQVGSAPSENAGGQGLLPKAAPAKSTMALASSEDIASSAFNSTASSTAALTAAASSTSDVSVGGLQPISVTGPVFISTGSPLGNGRVVAVGGGLEEGEGPPPPSCAPPIAPPGFTVELLYDCNLFFNFLNAQIALSTQTASTSAPAPLTPAEVTFWAEVMKTALAEAGGNAENPSLQCGKLRNTSNGNEIDAVYFYGGTLQDYSQTVEGIQVDAAYTLWGPSPISDPADPNATLIELDGCGTASEESGDPTGCGTACARAN